MKGLWKVLFTENLLAPKSSQSLPFRNNREKKDISFENLEQSLTGRQKAYEAAFNITLMATPAPGIPASYFIVSNLIATSLYHQRFFLCQVKTTRASAIYSVQLHFIQDIQLVTLLELQFLFMDAWEIVI